MFELRLKSFENAMSRDASGKCCDGRQSNALDGACLSGCNTRFRVCLKHYQKVVDPDEECTFGETVTPVMANNVANFDTIAFPIEFKWPVSNP